MEREECGGGEWWRERSVEVVSVGERGVGGGEWWRERSVEVVSVGERGVWRW